MKLIDENGRVLGIINIIDLTVLLFIISTITGFSWLIYTGELFKDHDPVKKEFIEKIIEVELQTADSNIIQLIMQKINQREENKIGQTKILNITLLKQTTMKDTSDEIKIISDDIYKIKILVSLPTHKDRKTELYYYFAQPIEINNKLSLQIENSTIIETNITNIK